jgi:type II secretory pathway pseudopilin PulG
MSPSTSSDVADDAPAESASGESGFSLASLLVILTIMAVFLAYTVPRMWSDVMRRQRERQTIFVMKQYARAVLEYQKSHANTAPTQLAQLKDSRRPRVIRGVGQLVDPLTGRFDWVPIPFGTITPGTTAPGTAPPAPAPAPPPGSPGGPGGQKIDAANFVGPFIGVKPGISGESLMTLNEKNHYEEWIYTVTDLQRDINSAVGGAAPSAGVLH